MLANSVRQATAERASPAQRFEKVVTPRQWRCLRALALALSPPSRLACASWQQACVYRGRIGPSKILLSAVEMELFIDPTEGPQPLERIQDGTACIRVPRAIF